MTRIRALFISCLVACAHHRTTWTQPEADRDRPGVVYLVFAGSSAASFATQDGKPCQPIAAHPETLKMLGWTSTEAGSPICSHDTLYDGLHTATLELRWTGQIPNDGYYELNTFGYELRTLGDVLCRGAWVGDTFANATLVVEAKSLHCSMTWSTPLAATASFGPWVREKIFYGYQEVPPLALSGCKAGESLEVRARLVAESNRGRIDVEAFGFLTSSEYDSRHLFGLLPRAEPPRVEVRVDERLGHH